MIRGGLPVLAVSTMAALFGSSDLLPMAVVALCGGRRTGVK
jgi:hypothetical protein